MKIKKFFYQNDQRKKLYKIRYKRKFLEYLYYSFMCKNKKVHAFFGPHCTNPVLFDAQGLNRGHAFINGNDIGLYWLIPGICLAEPRWCQQVQINCNQPTQRYYHIPSDWLMPKNNLFTIFDDSGAPSPQSVGFLQRVVTN
jgi:hypothetical protein